MLVLNRKIGEAIRITLPDGKIVIVTVVQIKPRYGEVVLGFKADRSVPIHRSELIDHQESKWIASCD